MSNRRYCKKCHKETLHDKIEQSPVGTAGIIYLTILTMGFGLLMREPGWKRQQCDSITDRTHGD
jgi:hypothetical protein